MAASKKEPNCRALIPERVFSSDSLTALFYTQFIRNVLHSSMTVFLKISVFFVSVLNMSFLSLFKRAAKNFVNDYVTILTT